LFKSKAPTVTLSKIQDANKTSIKQVITSFGVSDQTSTDAWDKTSVFRIEHKEDKAKDFNHLNFKDSYKLDQQNPWTTLLVTSPIEGKIFILTSPIENNNIYLFSVGDEITNAGNIPVEVLEDNKELDRFLTIVKSASSFWKYLAAQSLIPSSKQDSTKSTKTVNTKSGVPKIEPKATTKKPRTPTKKSIAPITPAKETDPRNDSSSKPVPTKWQPKPMPKDYNPAWTKPTEPKKTKPINSSYQEDWMDYILT